MSTRRYYYFCHTCGGDTASYDLVSVCPYCRSHRPSFSLVDEAEISTPGTAIAEKIELLRQRWANEHPRQEPGSAKAKKGRGFFGKRRFLL